MRLNIRRGVSNFAPSTLNPYCEVSELRSAEEAKERKERLTKCQKRCNELDSLIKRLYEDKVAGGLLMSVSKDERERAVYRSRRMFQTDMQSNIATAEDRGRQEGVLAITRNMLKRNRPIDEIIEDTGLTREEVENLDV